MRIALLVLFLSAAAEAAWTAPTKMETAILVAVHAMVVVDVAQSFDIKNHPGNYEQNPFLGSHPTDLRLIATAAASMALVDVLWYWNPRTFGSDHFWRHGLLAGVLLGEAATIALNHAGGLRIQF